MADELRVDSGALIFATLADVYISSGMIDEAISILKDGLLRNPNYQLAKVILGRAYYLKGEFDKAVETLEMIYEDIKDDESANLYLGHSYFKMGDNVKAKKFYEAALKINDGNTEALQALEKLIPDFTPKAEVQPAVPAESGEPEAIEVEEVIHEVILPSEPEAATQDEVSISEPIGAEREVELPTEPPEVVPEKETGEELTIESFVQELPEKKTRTESVPLEALDKPVERLLALDNVKSVFIATKDGLLIKNYTRDDSDVEVICASIAGICLDVDEAFRMLKRGGLTRCIIEKPDETICVMAVGDSLLIVITKVEAKPGLVFVYARKIIEEIEEILG
ncbi:MAG: tetratricopeptide repeat protein [candidate division WOR-3 bacterium]|nr:tetratricopeptide repeat protein [candidate division WOR-3 bacterium]